MSDTDWPPNAADIGRLWAESKGRLRPAAEIRKELRAALTPGFSCFSRERIEEAFAKSDHIKADLIDPRPTPSGIIHALDMDTLGWLAANPATGPALILEAIEDNDTTAPFGRPSEVDGEHASTIATLNELAVEHHSHLAEQAGINKATIGASMTTTSAAIDLSKLAKVDPGQATILNSVLASMGLPNIADIGGAVGEMQKKIADSASMVGKVDVKIDASLLKVAAAGGLPAGGPKTAKASKLFGITGKAASAFDFDMIHFEWDKPHPHVPTIDPDYQFDPQQLLTALFSILTNKKMWLHGHTGTGKSTFVEQVCARLNWPLMRVNFDSEITRMDLIGRDVLQKDGGTTVTKFVDGILPTAMSSPSVLLCDELDFIRPDVAYVFQRALEDKGLMITEDGGRLITPHPLFRIVATGNTQGQGDDHGIYAGARPQSLALLDRFTSWLEFDYMDKAGVTKLLKDRVAKLPENIVGQIANYCIEHWTGFKQRQITTPLSPRGVIALGDAAVMFLSVLPEREAIKAATNSVLLKRATPADRTTITGIIDRTFRK